MAKRRSEEREAFWREQVRTHAASGLSVRRFCEANGLSEASFYAWRRTLQQRDQPATTTPQFVPLMLSPVVKSDTHITIELRGGRVLRLPGTMATERLIALLRGLYACPFVPRSP